MNILIDEVNGRKDKNDVLLRELLVAQNWKQALSNCEKRAKKGERSDRFMVNKALVLLHFPDPVRQKQGWEEIQRLLDRKPPITDPTIISAIEAIFEFRRQDDASISSMWERAAAQEPGSETLLNMWYKKRLERNDYKSAQKAATQLRTSFPKSRKYYYMAIVSSHLVASALNASDNDRKLFGMLAYRFLDKAAKDAVSLAESAESAKTNSDDVKSLKTPSDIQLLVAVYRDQGRFQEATEVLNSPRIGIKSRIGANSWELTRLMIGLYEATESWEELFALCRQLLLDALPESLSSTSQPNDLGHGVFGDDFAVWAGLIRAARCAQSKDKTSSVDELIRNYLSQKSISRNARLAHLLFLSNSPHAAGYDYTELSDSVSTYFHSYSSKSVCFSDLRHYIHRLPQDRQSTLLIEIACHAFSLRPMVGSSESSKIPWLVSEINVLKLDYYLIVSRSVSGADVASLELLKAFISNCLRLYKLSLPLGSDLPPSERRPGDDAAILAAMALIRLYIEGDKTALLRSTMVLEYLLSHSKHNYDALLILIRLYTYLGVATQAVEHYKRLDIKNVQHSTIAWILFMRLSSIHPSVVASKGSQNAPPRTFDPATELSRMLASYKKNTLDMQAGIEKCAEGGSYYNMLDTISLKSYTDNDFSKWMFICELERMQRLNHSEFFTNNNASKMKAPSRFVHDSRDWDAFPNYEAEGRKGFVEYLHFDNVPRRQWLASQLRIHRLWGFVKGRQHEYIPDDALDDLIRWNPPKKEITDTEAAVNSFVTVLEMTMEILSQPLNSKTEEDDEDFFDDEKAVTEFLHHIGELLKDYQKSAANSLRNHHYQMLALSPKLCVPYQDCLHALFLVIDSFRILMPCMDLFVALNNLNKRIQPGHIESWAITFQKRILEQNAVLTSIAKGMRQKLDEAGSEEIVRICLGGREDDPDVVDDPVGKELRDLFPKDWLDDMSAILMDGWRESLDGLERVIKVPGPRHRSGD